MTVFNQPFMCECGCGRTVAPGRRFVRGHNVRGHCHNPAGRPATPASERFESKVSRGSENDCWLWTGRRHVWGYGYFAIAPGNSQVAHRYGYELWVRPLQQDEQLHHICENKPCVNPAHLEVVSIHEHMQRHRKTRCSKGHALTPDNRVEGGRCRACRNKWYRERYRRRAA